jgi:hypothetical protein
MPTVTKKYAPFIEVIFENIQQINDIKHGLFT